MTSQGGLYGWGTVFSLDPKTGVETVLHSFSGSPDGAGPNDYLVDVGRRLYGTTSEGGLYSWGTVFSLDPKTDAETILYSFCPQQPCPDGAQPSGGLIYLNGALYGTTVIGGLASDGGDGTVFSLDPNTGVETVLHSFTGNCSGCSDGANPLAGPTSMNAILYGTTSNGGGSAQCYSQLPPLYGCGTVYSLDLGTRTEAILHSFCITKRCRDGSYPEATLLRIKGKLYGTTDQGGHSAQGTAFSLDLKTGTEKTLHSFGSGTDGAFADFSLIAVNGTLYGTTAGGGLYGWGTVYSLDRKTGAETILYSFCPEHGCKDGAEPSAGLIDVNGTLYGTTIKGGANGGGTVFSIAP